MEFLRLKIKSNMIPSIDPHGTSPRMHARPATLFFRRGFPAATSRIPTRSVFLHESGRKLGTRQLVLCSLGAEVREAGTARRFRFLNWNFHGF